MSGKTRLSIASLGVIATIGILFAVLPAIGSSHGEVIRLRLDSSTSALTYGSATQSLSTTRCQIDNATAAGNLVNISATNRGPGLVDGIGVKSGGSNGTPCSFADSTETLAFTAPPASDGLSPVAGRDWVRLRLDVEAKGNAWIVARLYDGSALVDTHELVTGSSIAQYNLDNGTDLVPNPGPPYTAETNGSPVAACASASDSGPDSGINDNCLWTIIPSQAFNRVEITTLVGEVSIEGGGDYEGVAGLNQVDFETWFYLNSAPVAIDDLLYQVDEDETLTVFAPGVLGNDEDPDGGQTLTASLVSAPSSGLLTFSEDGSFVYEPALNFNGPVTFTYEASDGSATSDPATVRIFVNPVNDPPVASNDSVTTDEDTQVVVNVLANDTDEDGDQLTVLAVDTAATKGTVNVTANGVTYDPNGQFESLGTGDTDTDTFAYTMSDGSATSEALVTVTVTGVNDPPVIGVTEFTGNEDSSIAIDLMIEDPDDTSFITACTSDDGEFTASSLNDGTGTFEPSANFDEVATLFCSVNDSEITVEVTVTVNVSAVNDAPIAVDDTYEMDERASVDTAATFTANVLDNDTDIDNAVLTVTAVNGADSPVDIFNGGNLAGSLTFGANGSFSYTPNVDYPWAVDEFVRTDTWQYTVSDGSGGSDTATVSMTVYRVVCNGETVSDTDGDVTGSFTLISSDVPCKRYTVDAEDGGSGTSETVTFDSSGTGTADFRGFLSFEPDTLDPATGTFALGLEYDPDGDGPRGFQTMQVCLNPVFDASGLVTSATLPADESWCWASAVSTATGPSGEIQTVHQIYGKEDPIFRVK